jgi:hypothetical protein
VSLSMAARSWAVTRPAAALLCAALRHLTRGACFRRHGGVRSSRVCPLARMVSDATSAGIRTLR